MFINPGHRDETGHKTLDKLEKIIQGPSVHCRSFGNTYGDQKHVPTEKENQEVLTRARELGVTFVDSADV